MSNKNSQKVLISMPEQFLTAIDELAEKEQRTRSELIREALRQYLKNTKVEGQSMNWKQVIYSILNAWYLQVGINTILTHYGLAPFHDFWPFLSIGVAITNI